MLRIAIILSCILGLIPQKVRAASPTTAPSDFWLDRAAADIRAGLAHPTTNPSEVMLQPAIWLVEARGNDADRALLRQALNTPFPPATQESAKENFSFDTDLFLAEAYTVLKDRDSATTALEQAEKAKTTGMIKMVRASLLARGWAKLGNVDRAIALGTKAPFLNDHVYAYCNLAIDFHDAGNFAARDRCFHEALVRATAPSDPMNQGYALKELVDAQTKLGLFDAASATAQEIPPNRSRYETYLLLAKRCHAQNDAARTQQALARAAESVGKLNDDQLEGYEHLVTDAARFVQMEIAQDGLKQMERLVLVSDTPAWQIVRAPMAAAAAQDRARLDEFMQLAQDAILREPSEDRASAWLLIAAAWARIGERARCDAAIDRSKELKRQDDYFNSAEYGEMLTAWVQSGHPDIAISFATRDFSDPNDLDLPYAQCSLGLLDAGNFAAAWDAADHIRKYQHLRFSCYSKIAASQTRAGQQDQAAAKIDRIENPHSHATVDLQVAGRLLGLYGKWTLHADED